ncbi:pantoate--beta-alanine ligase [soil metagenome]
MRVAAAVDELRGALEAGPRGSVGFVPTMGALHEGHLALVAAARARSEVVVLSIFVNPMHFGPGEDYDGYPRAEGRDLELAAQAGVDVVFRPVTSDIYPPNQPGMVTVSAGPLGTVLEGAARPGHFDGVLTVVAKLFNLIRPDQAWFGQKDAQQLALVKRMVTDLRFPVEIHACPTVRAPDGLAISSRNAYLSSEERVRATVLHRALLAGRAALERGTGAGAAESAMAALVSSEPGVTLDYARVVDPVTFGAPQHGGPALVAGAVQVGATRLIDNLLWPLSGGEGA